MIDTRAKAARSLRVWMAEREVSRKELAAMLDCSTSQLSRWRMGLGRPGLDYALELERITDGAVSAGSWKETA